MLLCLLALIGCRDQTDGRVRIDFWAMGREGEIVQALMEDFERLHPDIRVKVQQIPWSAAHEKLLTAYAGDRMPDVFQLGNTWIPEFVALDAIIGLDAWIEASVAVARADFFAGIIETNELEGRLYGVPWYVDTRLLFYRKDILARAGVAGPPRSWQDWRRAMARIKQVVGPEADAIILPSNEWAPLVILALQLDAALLTGDGECGNFSAPAFREALTFYLSMFQEDFASATASAQIANLYQEFASGRFSMYISGPWNLGEFKHRLPAALQDAWSTAPMPSPNGTYPGVSLAGGASLAIYRGAEHKEAAWKLVEFLSATPQQIRFHRLSGNLPARRSAWDDAALAEDPRTLAFFEQLQRVRSTPKIPEWERIATAITRRVEQLVRGERTLVETLEALDAQVDDILEKRRWLLAGGGAAGSSWGGAGQGQPAVAAPC